MNISPDIQAGLGCALPYRYCAGSCPISDCVLVDINGNTHAKSHPVIEEEETIQSPPSCTPYSHSWEFGSLFTSSRKSVAAKLERHSVNTPRLSYGYSRLDDTISAFLEYSRNLFKQPPIPYLPSIKLTVSLSSDLD